MQINREHRRMPTDDRSGIHLRTLAVSGHHSARRWSQELAVSARDDAGLPAIVVLRDPISHQAAICAVSPDADDALLGRLIETISAAGRALMSGTVVTGQTCAELLGAKRAKNQHGSGGVAIPLKYGVGYLVSFGPRRACEKQARRLTKVARSLGDQIVGALERQTLACDATADALTGLPNSDGFSDEVGKVPAGGVALQFDIRAPGSVNATGVRTFGERQLGRALQEFVRTSDVLARVTPGVFLAWLRDLGTDDVAAVRERLKGVATAPISLARDRLCTPECEVTIAGMGSGREVVSHLGVPHAANRHSSIRVRSW